jgi:hypothetical protein
MNIPQLINSEQALYIYIYVCVINYPHLYLKFVYSNYLFKDINDE